MRNVIHFLSLFGSLGTLFCCALPVLFVTLGMGATFASVTATVPQINWFLEHKNALFLATGLLLLISYALIRYAKNLSCPVQADAEQACQKARPMAKWILYSSIIIYVAGALFSYVIPKILYG